MFSKDLTELIQKDYHNIAGIVIRDNQETIFENYFHGYTQNDTLHIASVTKSITSILMGIAIDQGLIQNVEQTVLDFFPEYEVKKREKTIHKVTIKHLLTMTTPYKYKYEPYTKVYSSENWTKTVLDLLGGKTLSGDFKYSTIGLQVLSGIIEKATGKSLNDFAAENLFQPLDMKKPNNLGINNREEYTAFLKDKYVNGWIIDPQGTNTAGWGLTLTTKDLAKIGQLYLNMGKWGNQQIISKEWIEESTKVHSKWGERSYGYLWWIVDDKKNKCFTAIGDGGNILYVDAGNKIVVAITSRFMPRAKDRIELIRKHIVPQIEMRDDGKS
ncbi:serine hydrolase domain-containing protein [Tindallia californiensis]|uniref:CubicO group peptidase, beta-lactamase class C family n=1 Tax=Tindallia californiensis TaxID=159292 RepID=A0A1H3PRJ2_9FIRM|nr:serine hydrolase [Tindallia californiensis]SDZ03581.1 CubicO group peptidase, beta-lactamase class C family [Tindallia californiensis]